MTALEIGLALAIAALIVLAAFYRASSKRSRLRFQILEDIASVADGGRSLEQTLDAIAAILVPALGDYCMIDVIEEDQVRRAAVRVDGPGAEAIEKGLAERKPALQEQIADAASVARQEPRLFEHVTEADLRPVAESEEDLAFLLSMNVRSFVTLELRARGRPTGILSVGVSHSGRRYRQDDADFFAILAGRVALALDNAGLFSNLERSERERAEIAATLQRGLLPSPLPHIPGWSLAAMYRPAGAENEIGGDFYDAFRIAGGWMVVIGDVTGRGAQAAAVTALARYTLRTAAALTGDPVIALETLNRDLLARPGASLCSVAAMAIDEDPSKPVRLAIAGHPAPLLVDRDAVVEATVSAPVLGAFPDASWGIEHVQVRPGQQLVVITDGVTESTGAEERFGEQRLRAALAGVSSPALAVQKVEGALNAFSAGPLDDDAAILAIAPTPVARRAGLGGGPRAGRAPLRGLQPARCRGDRGRLRRGPRVLPGRHRRGSRPHRALRRPGRPARLPRRRRSRLGRAADHADRGRAAQRRVAGSRPRLRPQPRARHPRRPDGLGLGRRRRPLHPRRSLPRPRPGAAAARRPFRGLTLGSAP